MIIMKDEEQKKKKNEEILRVPITFYTQSSRTQTHRVHIHCSLASKSLPFCAFEERTAQKKKKRRKFQFKF